ncbi:MAG: response regulator transcription factor [Clostridiaceae bacterium]
MKKIAIVEDDKKLCDLMGEFLSNSGYEIYVIEDFINIVEDIKKLDVDLVLLDINLPYFDGYYVCKKLRRTSNIPIIIISARSNEKDQILAIEIGADDYITKPFKLDILNSKVKAVLRRVYGEYSNMHKGKLVVKDIVLSEEDFKLSYKGQTVELSKNELKLIKKFFLNSGKIIRRAELFEELWDEENFVDDNTLTVNITRIKNIFKEFGITDAIKTKRGVGYIFNYGERNNY